MHTVLMQRPLCTRRCIFERCISAIVKDDWCYLELGKLSAEAEDWVALRQQCKAERPPPMAPDTFERMLREGVAREEAEAGTGIKFTSGKDPTEVVIPQYERGFLRLLGEAKALSYVELGWGDSQLEVLCAALSYAHGNGALGQLTELSLAYNSIGDSGMQAFASAVASGSLASLKELYLTNNQIGDAGMTAFAGAIGTSGAMAHLQKLWLDNNHRSGTLA